jgi:hypothetical protein
MINVLGLEQEDKDVIRESFEKLGQKYECVLDNDFIESFSSLINHTRLINIYSTVSIKNIFKITHADHTFYIISIYLANFTDRLAPRVLIYGLSFLDNDPGKIFIRPETLFDKFGDLFNKNDIDFEAHKGFSKRYCVFSDDKALAKKSLTVPFLEEVYNQKKLNLEFWDKKLLVTFNRKTTTEEVMTLAVFMEKMKSIGY